VGTAVERQTPDNWRWHGRRVLLADGLEVSMPDTLANQKAYPQLSNQKPGLGFPRMRLVVLLAFATACLVGCALGACKGKEVGETKLFGTLLKQIGPGDVVVADRYYCAWWILARLKQRGADACFRLHHRRHYDFRRGC
jgi:DDE family transposase